ncbi:MAG: hypothetical protein CBE24_05860 [bacterium TMED264]|nr:MAG: hypothetical protein CBE24_05860 [bacterium TMED264]|tara:strand:- start:686 stop:1552 length:867 start_codon:yes stop_codon:yes gene_type:complete
MPIIFKIFIFFHVFLFGIGSQFLSLPFSSKELSIGSHPTLFEHGPVNPSLYHAIQNRPSISFNQGVWFGDITLTQASYNFEKNDVITHFGFKYSGITDLEFRNDSPSDNPLSYFSSFGISLDAGKAAIRDNQRYGISISYVHFGIFTYESKGIGINLGYSIDLVNKIKVGVVMQNLGKMSKLQSDEILLPRRILAGVSKGFKFNQIKNSVYTSIEKNALTPNAKMHLGNHFNWNRFNLFSGISSSKNILETSIGFGLLLSRFEIVYGLRFGSQNIGIPQIISIRFLML